MKPETPPRPVTAPSRAASASATASSSAATLQARAGAGLVVVSGQANLFDPRSVDPDHLDRMRHLLRTLEDKEVLLQLLDRTRAAEGIQVFLGAETAHAALSDSSVVAVSYGPEEHPLGAIAVIGPMRMNYGKVMSVVDFTADLLTQLLADE